MSPLEEYINSLQMIRRSGMAVKETSYYGSLESLLNKIGSQLKPFVRSVINTKNIGSGIPDGGLFTKDQFSNGEENSTGTIPSRGAIEIKGTSEQVIKIAESEQVRKYLKGYGQVLVTNYYQFLLVVQDEKGNPHILEGYKIEENENNFWKSTLNPKEIIAIHEERLSQFLLRVMLHAAPLSEPKDVAWFLASYARDAKSRIEQLELQALTDVKLALEESLGMTFSGEKGDHFFRSTLIQTIFYGVFSSWVLHNKDKTIPKEKFNWRLAGWYLKVPMIKALFERVANPTSLGRLGLIEVLDWTSNVLNRIDQQTFFNKFEETKAVLYFYEPFLQAFDSELRKDLGVWYTPIEVVKYMVEKVDRALREELNIPRGLADKRVYILDPCCGTGAYLVEIIKRINKTLISEGADALTGHDLKEAALNRIFGFEILPAPFVVAHLQLGILLENLGANFIENKNERVGIYLTNSLTGWEPPKEIKLLLNFPELQEEKDAAEKVKREKPILVIMGNPPYNAFAGISPEEEGDLVEPYKEGLIEKWGIKKFNLDELYVRFLRVAEKKISSSDVGIISFISSFTYIFKESFVVMREKFIENFSTVWIDSLNGSSRETGKLTPEGTPDPSIFSTSYNPAGIKLGTAISLFVKKQGKTEKAKVFYREFWGQNKRNELIDSLDGKGTNYVLKYPQENNLFSFNYTESLNINYKDWLSLDDICQLPPMQGLDEDRKFDLIEFEVDKLSERINKYYDSDLSLEQLKPHFNGLTYNSADFDAQKARKKILKEDSFNSTNIQPYLFRGFDLRYCYYSEINPLWKRPRPELKNQFFEKNKFILCRKSSSADPEGNPFYFTTSLFARDAIKGHATAIPFKIKKSSSSKHSMSIFDDKIEDNISERVKEYLKHINCKDASMIWWHVLAIGYSQEYISENQGSIKISYPRIPFPNNLNILKNSAEIGIRISSLLDLQQEVKGVTVNPNHLNKSISVLSSTNNEIDMNLNAKWGNKTPSGIMPGKGKYESRNYTVDEYELLIAEGYTKEQVHHALGDKTLDVYINSTTFWMNIPSKVWEYHIGGYQVIKKWLSYRESAIIKRSLTKEELRTVTNIARRITSILLMEKELSNNYLSTKKDYFNFTKI